MKPPELWCMSVVQQQSSPSSCLTQIYLPLSRNKIQVQGLCFDGLHDSIALQEGEQLNDNGGQT